MSKDEYLITDAPLKALTVFAMPMILGSFFQQVYNMADSIIVGQFVGSSALAAVGACAALTNVFICVALGAGVGAGVLVSRYFGAREYGKMKTIVSTSLISFLLLSIILGVFGFCFSHAMMSGLQTPADILEEAVLYLRVYFVGFPFLFMYNILSTMFTSIGESKIPLGLLIFSSILNIVMDLWMVADLGLGVFGAALATLIAQGISAVFSLLIFFYRMRRYKSSFVWFDGQELRSMLQIAVPSVLQQSTVSIGMMIVQAVVNPFGTQALAGYAATMRVENVFSLIFVSIGNAVSPYVSQNLGANKTQRIKKGYRAALMLDVCFAVLAFLVIETLHTQISRCSLEKTEPPWLIRCPGLYEMAWLLLYLYGYQNGNRRSSSRTRNHAAVPYCQYGKPCDSPVCGVDLCSAFWYCICLACRAGRLACQLPGFARHSENPGRLSDVIPVNSSLPKRCNPSERHLK